MLQNSILSWVEEMEKYRSPDWANLPDIDLYMDQVITYLERQLSAFSLSDEEKYLTPAMINNYVKNEIIPRPLQKKYTREHLAHLMAIMSLKQVLSLSDIKKIISLETLSSSVEALHDQFNQIQYDSLQETSSKVREALAEIDKDSSEDEIEKRLSLLALKLSLEANAHRIAAKQILDQIVAHRTKSQEVKEKESSKESSKDKDKDKARELKGKDAN